MDLEAWYVQMVLESYKRPVLHVAYRVTQKSKEEIPKISKFNGPSTSFSNIKDSQSKPLTLE